MSSSAEVAPFGRLLVGGSFACAALLALRMAFESPAYFGVSALCVGLGVWSAGVGLRRARGPTIALAVLNLLFVVPELGLRSAGFRHVSGIQFGYPTAEEFTEFALDRELFWKLPPDGEWVHSWGFFGPEPRVPKPSGTRRILYLGDSCSQQGYPQAWPELATALLGSRDARPLDEVNLALSGYSSHQGLVLARRYGELLEPDLVVVYFGWNDHWLARGAPDARKSVELRFEGLYRSVRLLQLARKLHPGAPTPILDEPRVDRGAYAENLRAIVELFRARGATVLLVTAPSIHDLGVPEYLVEREFVRSAAEALELHEDYNRIVREIAEQSAAELFDLDLSLRTSPERRQWFLEDGIHFTEAGRHAVARLFAQRVQELGLLR